MRTTGRSRGRDFGDGDLFGQSSLHMRCPGGASGHETDKVSSSSPQGIVRLAKGTNVDDGGAELVYYETSAAARSSPPARSRGPARSWSTRPFRGSRRMCSGDSSGRCSVGTGPRSPVLLLGYPMRITQARSDPGAVPLKAGMVTKTAHGDHHTSDYVIVRVHTDDGTRRSGRGDGLGALERRDEQELRRGDRPT